MSRALTANEQAVLAHVVSDPIQWWEHAHSASNIATPEEALSAKVARHQAAYDAAVATEGEDYQTRAQREAAEV